MVVLDSLQHLHFLSLK